MVFIFVPAGKFYSYTLSEIPLPESSIRTFAAPDVEVLVRDVFLKDDCSNVSNITRIGDQRGVGFFDTGANIIGLPEGIILASGLVSNATGPNFSTTRTSNFGDDSTDPDLELIATNQIFDKSGIEFDFVPQKEIISFSYVFASEEYCEYVGSIFNDVFGFFVSGPGINGPFDRNAINVALIPDSDEFVSINNVNHAKNSDYYVKNELEDDATNCGIEYNPQFLQEIEYDGFTIRLKATFRVIPCETYHIRLVVGDVGDHDLDTAVFLEAKSFDIGPEVKVDYQPDDFSLGNILIEGCNSGSLVFSRTDLEKIDQDLEVNYNFSESTTTTEGVDFENLPRPIIIPANETQVSIPFSALSDNNSETAESMGIKIETTCNCLKGDNTLVMVEDHPPLAIDTDTLELCPGEPAELSPTIISGLGPYTYQWENGTTTPVLIIDSVNTSRNYALTISDYCGDSINTFVYTSIYPLPRLNLSGVYDWCDGNLVEIPLELSGNAPWQLEYSWGNNLVFLDSIVESNFVLQTDRPGDLQISYFADSLCIGEANGQVSVVASGPIANPQISAVSCPGSADASVNLNIESPFPYEVRWSTNVNNPETPTNLGAGRYAFTITDSNNCAFSDSIIISQPTIPEAIEKGCTNFTAEGNVFIPNAFSPNFDGENDEFRIYSKPDFQGQVIRWSIFDRWGNLLFEARDFQLNDSNIYWDGRYKGRILSSGVYIYSLEVETAFGEKEIISGSVTLIR